MKDMSNMEGKTYFSTRLKQFDGLTWLTLPASMQALAQCVYIDRKHWPLWQIGYTLAQYVHDVGADPLIYDRSTSLSFSRLTREVVDEFLWNCFEGWDGNILVPSQITIRIQDFSGALPLQDSKNFCKNFSVGLSAALAKVAVSECNCL